MYHFFFGDVVFFASQADRSAGYDMAGIPSVSWNTKYGLWLAVFTSMTGFWYTTSQDGLTWVQPRILLRHPVLVSDESMVNHEPFVYYPSLIDPLADQDGRTSSNGILLYAHGDWMSAHHMIGRAVNISRVQVEDSTLPNTGKNDIVNLSLLAIVGLGAGITLKSRKPAFSSV